jgi:hypothetical protein
MAGSYRHQVLIEAPIEDVWAVVSDPRTHPDWWPDVIDVRIDEPLVEGGEYVRSSRLLPFLSAVDAVRTAERLEHLKEAHFSLTAAQTDTFVELETGMDPTRLRWRAVTAAAREVFARRLAARRVTPASGGYVRPITAGPETADSVE